MVDPGSRYAAVPAVATPDARGRVLTGTDVRLLPDVVGTLAHQVQQGDRLDLLAEVYYGRPAQWWRICDANPDVLSPLALVGAEPVVTTDVPVAPDPVADPPPWSGLLTAVGALPGVRAVVVVPDPARPDGWALRVTHNTAVTPVAALLDQLGPQAFRRAGPPTGLGRVGAVIAVPPPASA